MQHSTPGFQALSDPQAFGKAFVTSVQRWPWLLMTLFVTIAIAWAADDAIHLPHPAPNRLRVAETVALATVFGLLQWLVLELFVTLDPPYGKRLMDRQLGIVSTAIVVGACIGALVPHVYRQRMRSAQPVPAAPLVPAAAA